MNSPLEQVFWRAVDDLNAGRVEPVERYLELVPSHERDELASMLATVLATRSPAADPAEVGSEGYARALAAIDGVIASAGPAGVLPGALRTMRHARGIDRDQVIDALAEEFHISGADGRKTLARFYHQLETGKLLGSQLASRLIACLAKILDADPQDLIAGSRPSGPPAQLAAVPAMARRSGSNIGSSAADDRRGHLLGPDREIRLVERLFTGGRDA